MDIENGIEVCVECCVIQYRLCAGIKHSNNDNGDFYLVSEMLMFNYFYRIDDKVNY